MEDDLRKAAVLSTAAKQFAESTNASPPAPSPVMTPQTLSELSDELLSARIDKVLTGTSFEENEEYVPSGLPPVAPFITFEVLLRVRNLLATRPLEQRGELVCALAAVVADITGVRLPSTVKNVPKSTAKHVGSAGGLTLRYWSPAKEIGSLMNTKLDRHLAATSKIKNNSRKRTRFDDITALDRSYYVCPHGGTPPPPPEPKSPVPEEAQGMAHLVQAAEDLAPRRGRTSGDTLYELHFPSSKLDRGSPE